MKITVSFDSYEEFTGFFAQPAENAKDSAPESKTVVAKAKARKAAEDKPAPVKDPVKAEAPAQAVVKIEAQQAPADEVPFNEEKAPAADAPQVSADEVKAFLSAAIKASASNRTAVKALFKKYGVSSFPELVPTGRLAEFYAEVKGVLQ